MVFLIIFDLDANCKPKIYKILKNNPTKVRSKLLTETHLLYWVLYSHLLSEGDVKYVQSCRNF